MGRYTVSLCLCPRPTGSGFGGSTSSVVSSNKNPIANLGEDQLLSCYVNAGQNSIINQVSVTWEKKGLTGLVYKYADGADDLTDQNPQFKARTQVFPGSLVGGNGSLLLRAVRSSDEGEYTCSISSSEGKGTVNIQLRTAGRMTRLSGFTVCLLWKLISGTLETLKVKCVGFRQIYLQKWNILFIIMFSLGHDNVVRKSCNSKFDTILLQHTYIYIWYAWLETYTTLRAESLRYFLKINITRLVYRVLNWDEASYVCTGVLSTRCQREEGIYF